MKNFFASWSASISRFLYVQLFLTLISLPILMYWGIPISLLTFIGNFIFSPLLTVFLLLSSLVFFCALLSIPHRWIAWALELVTSTWLWCLKSVSGSWFIGFNLIHPLFLLMLIVAVLTIIHARIITTAWRGIGCLIILVVLFYGICALSGTPEIVHSELACSKGIVSVIKDNSEVIVYEQNGFGRTATLESWLEYTLMPEVIKKTGKTSIDHFAVSSVNVRTLRAIKKFTSTVPVRTLYIPGWQKIIPSRLYAAYQELKWVCKKNNTKLVYVHNRDRTINDRYLLQSNGYKDKEDYQIAQFSLESVTA